MTKKARKEMPDLDVIIVGAGPAGLGCAIALKQCGIDSLLLVDRVGIGAAFEKWPAQMRMITPSFYSNPYNQPDLNAITPDTSPADFLRTEHPTGPDYARYLRALAEHFGIVVRTGLNVLEIQKEDGSIFLMTNEEPLRARFVVWAAGEFFFPNHGGISGAEHCLHNSAVADWKALSGVEHAVVGGFESGIDAAIHLAWAGKTVHVLSRGEPWHRDSSDPSRTITPYTRDRLKNAFLEAPGTIRFYKNADIAEVIPLASGFALIDREGDPFEVSTPPILCTGFRGGLGPALPLFADSGGLLAFTEEADESPNTPGLFYSGPLLRHRNSLFCFIYKFRGRFGIVARAIAERLGREWEKPLAIWRDRGFMIDDLHCCTDCTCAVAAPDEATPATIDYVSASS